MGPILVVDDNDDLRELFAEILRSEGYNVLEASNGECALTLLNELGTLPALVLLDRMMPRMSGAELLNCLANDARLAALPVVIVSASTDKIETLGRPYLRKPVSASTLLAFVNAHFAKLASSLAMTSAAGSGN